ncbi:MAG: MFS transporter [Actinobacteria bacterium]|nr:MAG: MFS transporter [Actinomycetota bacterium]
MSDAWTRPRFLAPLAIRDFALIWAATAISRLGDGLYLVAIAWQTYAISNVPTAMSIVGIATTLPQLVLLLFSGALSDRLPRRRLMVSADALRAVAIGTLGALALADALSLAVIVGLVAVYAVGTSLFQPASISLLPQVVPAERRAQANGLMRLAGALAVRLVGPALGGGIVGAFGAGTAFLADAATFVVSLSLLLMVSAYPLPDRAAKSLLADVREGLGFVRRQGWLTTSLVAASIGLLCYEGPTAILLPFLIKNHFDGHAADLGLVLSAGGAGAVLAALLISHFGLPQRRMGLMYLLWTVLASSVLLYAVAGSIWQLAVVCFLAIGAMIGGDVIWTTLLQDHVPHELLGRVASLDTVVSFSLVPLSMALTGPIAAAAGARPTMLVAGTVGVSCVAGLFLTRPSLRHFDVRRADIGDLQDRGVGQTLSVTPER